MATANTVENSIGQKFMGSLAKVVSQKGVSVFLMGAMVTLAVGCGAPKRGESELAYKNRLAKYTIAGVLIGGYFGAYRADLSSPLPIDQLDKIIPLVGSSNQQLVIATFYAALGGYAGYSLVKYEGEVQRLIFEMQKQLSVSAHQALAAKDIEQSYAWSLPEENASGDFKVVDRYTGSEGNACQDLIARVKSSDDSYESVQQTACQNPAGQWVLWTRG